MVRKQLQFCEIKDLNVLRAMEKVPRHLFVEEALQSQAYSNLALPIGYGQTISQPLSVAKITAALQVLEGMKILEIGTGSGYQAAILAEMGAEIFSIERVRPLYFSALKRLSNLHYFQVKLKCADGTLGWPEKSPFDRILISASGPNVPKPLLRQLGESGIFVMPLGTKEDQRLIRIRKNGRKYFKQDLGKVNFVDLVGQYGW